MPLLLVALFAAGFLGALGLVLLIRGGEPKETPPRGEVLVWTSTSAPEPSSAEPEFSVVSKTSGQIVASRWTPVRLRSSGKSAFALEFPEGSTYSTLSAPQIVSETLLQGRSGEPVAWEAEGALVALPAREIEEDEDLVWASSPTTLSPSLLMISLLTVLPILYILERRRRHKAKLAHAARLLLRELHADTRSMASH